MVLRRDIVDIKISDLPDELLVQIFMFLDPKSLLDLSLVDSRFRRLSNMYWQQRCIQHFSATELNHFSDSQWHHSAWDIYKTLYKEKRCKGLNKRMRHCFYQCEDEDIEAIDWPMVFNNAFVLDNQVLPLIDLLRSKDNQRLLEPLFQYRQSLGDEDCYQLDLIHWAIICRQPDYIVAELIDKRLQLGIDQQDLSQLLLFAQGLAVRDQRDEVLAHIERVRQYLRNNQLAINPRQLFLAILEQENIAKLYAIYHHPEVDADLLASRATRQRLSAVYLASMPCFALLIMHPQSSVAMLPLMVVPNILPLPERYCSYELYIHAVINSKSIPKEDYPIVLERIIEGMSNRPICTLKLITEMAQQLLSSFDSSSSSLWRENALVLETCQQFISKTQGRLVAYLKYVQSMGVGMPHTAHQRSTDLRAIYSLLHNVHILRQQGFVSDISSIEDGIKQCYAISVTNREGCTLSKLSMPIISSTVLLGLNIGLGVILSSLDVEQDRAALAMLIGLLLLCGAVSCTFMFSGALEYRGLRNNISHYQIAQDAEKMLLSIANLSRPDVVELNI